MGVRAVGVTEHTESSARPGAALEPEAFMINNNNNSAPWRKAFVYSKKDPADPSKLITIGFPQDEHPGLLQPPVAQQYPKGSVASFLWIAQVPCIC